MAARIAPGTKADIGRVNHALASLIGLAAGGPPPHVFTTLARHRGLFRRWLLFAGGLMPGGRLPRADSELLILRVAHLTDCAYEWHHHERLGRAAGLSAEEVQRARGGPEAEGWTPRQRLLLQAADELIAGQRIADGTWAALAAELAEADLIELTLLVGHYVMLAGTINALGIEPDEPAMGPPKGLARLVQAAARRRGAA